MQRKTFLFILLAVTAIIWGSAFVFVDVAIKDGSSPIMLSMARFVVASLIFGAYLLVRRPSGVDREDRKSFLMLAFIGVGIYFILQYIGIGLAGASISSILVFLLCPVMIFVLSARRLGEKISGEEKVGLAIAACGSVLVITNGSISFISEWPLIVGGLLQVICAFFWAVYTVEGKKVVMKYDPIASTAYITIIGTIMMVPFAVTDAVITVQAFPVSFFVAALYVGVLCTVIGYVFWFRALTGLAASVTGATMYFMPIVTIIFAWMMLGDTIGWVSGMGGALTAVGVIIISRK
ncbi:MAG: DMT family transporter [Candidatus Thermoplasmatota archaeon]|nr:DMT family transporter [Candidatus Thermoplasmatota archaeon]